MPFKHKIHLLSIQYKISLVLAFVDGSNPVGPHHPAKYSSTFQVQMHPRGVFLLHAGRRPPEGSREQGAQEEQVPQVQSHHGVGVGAREALRGVARESQEVS